jgi:hypothetical protein
MSYATINRVDIARLAADKINKIKENDLDMLERAYLIYLDELEKYNKNLWNRIRGRKLPRTNYKEFCDKNRGFAEEKGLLNKNVDKINDLVKLAQLSVDGNVEISLEDIKLLL